MARKTSTTSARKAAGSQRRALIADDNHVEHVAVGAMRLGAALESATGKLFDEFGITIRQFNILRILYVRDPDGNGLPTGTIAERLLSRAPDVPRLVDRLVKAGLLERVRSEEDRRVVRLRLTREGLELVESVHEPLLANNRALFAHMSETELARLAEGLERALEGPLSTRKDSSS